MAGRIPTSRVWSILGGYYNIVPETVTKLKGYTHDNYKVVMQSSNFGENSCIADDESYIMKLVDVSHSYYCGNTDLQHAMLKHLHKYGIKSNLPVSSTDGRTAVDYTFGGKSYSVQLLSFLNGVSINDAIIQKNDMNRLAFDIGRNLGQLHNVLQNLEYDKDRASDVYSVFHVENAHAFEDKLSYVEHIPMRDLLQEYIDLYKQNFLPRIGDLRKGFIHGDFSDTNMIIKNVLEGRSHRERQWRIEGIIDLEECCYGYLVGDVGISMAYIMLKAASSGADPIDASQQALVAYESVSKLTLPEKQVLFEAMVSRLVVSYVSACYECSLAPENEKYLFSQACGVPSVMEQIANLGKSQIEEVWFSDHYRQSIQRRNKTPFNK